MNFPFEHKFRRTGQQYVAEITVALLETNFELIPALHLNLYRRTEPMNTRGDQGRSSDTGAASQSLAFNPSLKGSDANSIRAEQLYEIHIRALWAEVRVAANLRPELLDHGPVRIWHKEHRMRHPRIQGMNGLLAYGERHCLFQLQIPRWR